MRVWIPAARSADSVGGAAPHGYPTSRLAIRESGHRILQQFPCAAYIGLGAIVPELVLAEILAHPSWHLCWVQLFQFFYRAEFRRRTGARLEASSNRLAHRG